MKNLTSRWGWRDGAEDARIALDSARLAFDSVVVAEGTEEERMSVDAFLKLPLDRRIRLNFERKLRFYREGRSVASADALRSLMAAARSTA